MGVNVIRKINSDYTLLECKDPVPFPIIVAWKFDGKTWAQGHYFENLVQANSYIEREICGIQSWALLPNKWKK